MISDKQIIAEYKKALTAIRAELVKFNEKMGTGELKEWQRYAYARDVELYNNINAQLDKLGQRQIDLTVELQKYSYKKGYFAGIYDIDKKTGFAFSYASPGFANVPFNTVNTLIQDPLFLEFKTKMKNITDLEKANIKSIINQGILQGKGIGDISKKINKELGQKASRAQAIAHTETQRAVNKGTLDSYDYAKQNGVKFRKKWLHGVVASRSRKAYTPRTEHVELNGTYADVEIDGEMYFELKSGNDKGALTLAPGQFGLASQDANCTCTISAETVDYKPPVMPEGIKTDFSNFNSWFKEKIGGQML